MRARRTAARGAVWALLLCAALAGDAAPAAHALLSSGQYQLLFGRATEQSPASVSGLIWFWRPDAGMSVNGSGQITSIKGQAGTGVDLTPSASPPTRSVGTAPNGADMIRLSSGSAQHFTFPTQTLTRYTLFTAIAPDSLTGAKVLLGRSGTPTSFLQIQNAGAALQARASDSGSTLTTPDLRKKLVKSLQILAVTFDGSAGAGTMTVYRDCGAAETPLTGIGSTMVFDRLGITGASSNPFGGLLGPVVAYNRVLNAAELQRVCTWFDKWRPKYLYAAPAAEGGSDASTTPWLQSTPLAEPLTLLQTLRDGQIGAPKGGARFRTTKRMLTNLGGDAGSPDSTAVPPAIDGRLWGDTTKNPEIRFSIAPTPVLVSGTVYDLGPWQKIGDAEANPGDTGNHGLNCIYRVPGGALTFSGIETGYDTSNVSKICAINTATPTNPGVGQWGWSNPATGGNNRLYGNFGVALDPGDVEIPITPDGLALANLYALKTDRWQFRNLDLLFGNASCAVTKGSADIVYRNFRCFYPQQDGIDAHMVDSETVDAPWDGTSHDTWFTVVVGPGTGPTSGGSDGDGHSCHQKTRCRGHFDIIVGADKAGFTHQTGTTWSYEGLLVKGPQAAWYSANTNHKCGSGSLKNSVLILPASVDPLQNPVALNHTAYSTQPGSGICQMEAYNNTIYSPSNAAGRIGVQFSSVGGAGTNFLTLRNNIVTGFGTGVSKGSGPAVGDYAGDRNLYHGNGANLAGGLALGTGGVVADPLFVAPGTDFRLQSGSPAKGAAAAIPGLLLDRAGNARGTPPSIGAYE